MQVQVTGIPASQTLQIDDWASRITGMPDMWTSLMFDTAVSVFGRHIEAKLGEIDEDTKEPKWTLRQLLDLPIDKEELRQETLNALKWLEIEGRNPNRSGIVLS